MLVIVDYNAGNLRSVKRACDKLGIAAEINADPKALEKAERIIFPGVGAAPSAMATLKKTSLDLALKAAFQRGIPILGICLGTQIVLDHSEEGAVDTLGLVPGVTRKFQLPDPDLKIPHIGWNGIAPARSHPLLEGIQEGDAFYFVHSYYPDPAEESSVFARSDYGIPFCCALGRDNLFATQFHPEKSGAFGLKMLERFARWDGKEDGSC